VGLRAPQSLTNNDVGCVLGCTRPAHFLNGVSSLSVP
jgi:hypothetical protein